MANESNLRIYLAITIFFLAIAGLAQADTITVGSGAGYDFDTIQAGIDGAMDDDTVLVAPGEYVITEPVTFRGKAITVISEAGSDETTIRMGTPADTNRGSVVVFESSETAASVLDGFTITGGSGSSVLPLNEFCGGGILFDASFGTLVNCKIVQNSARHGGGVIAFSGSSTFLIDCTVVENTAKNGGGVMVYSGSSATLTNCIIKGNFATGVTYGVDGYGGGLFCGPSSMLTLTNGTITGNSGVRGGGGIHCWQNLYLILTNCAIMSNTVQYAGGGILCDSGSANLTNCVIARNTGANWGGGVMCAFPEASITISNCTIWGNSATEGGGVGCWTGSSAAVTNSILWGNTATTGNEIYLEQAPTEFSISYSNVAGGWAEATIEGGTLNWGEGNIDDDPLFADPNNNDYHLMSEAGRWDPNSQSWIQDDVTSPCIDVGDPNSDWTEELWPHGEQINMGAYGGTSQASMSLSDAGAVVYIQWLGHASVKIWAADVVIYVDPRNLSDSPHDATLVLVTHSHSDHYSPGDIAKVWGPETELIASADVIASEGRGQAMMPGQTIESGDVRVTGVSAYNINKPNHPKERNWVGFIIEIASKRIYVAGDTDLTDEMKALEDIDVAILPAGGTYTMDAVEAAEATKYLKPQLAIPYHWGQNVGTLSDAQTFAELAQCAVKIMTVGETISSDNWPEYSPLIAHWKLDETEGRIAHDSADDNDGTLQGEPLWQPTEGKVDGALQFNGIYDYVSTPFVLNPADGAFSVFAWINGIQPVQSFANVAIISQMDGTGTGATWLGVVSSDGKLMTGLVPPPVGRFVPILLVSESIITDGQWHHVGLVWDGSHRYLYVDGTEVAKDTKAQATLKSSDGGLYFGAGKNLEVGSFFSGLIDDIRIYNQPLSPEGIGTLAR